MLMDSPLFLTLVAVAIGTPIFMACRKFRFPQEKKDLDSSSPPSSPSPSSSPSSPSFSSSPYPQSFSFSSSPPSSLSSSSPPSSSSFLPSSSLSCSSASRWTHDVFPSFRGEDVRKNFLSHIQKEFRRKGIIPFIDNEIKRGESIGLELIQAIRRSKIAVVLLSRNYASSNWCLDELAEIMNCKKEGQTIFAIFYEVDPSHVKKLTGEFGAIFEKTCEGKTKEDIRRWRQAFAEVATIAGYDSRNWNDEAVMIEDIVTEIFKRLISSTPPRYMEGLIGMEAHMEKMKPLIHLGSDEVRTVGIWGPSGIGKTTIARVLHDEISNVFELSVFMTFKSSYARPICSDDHDERLHLEQQFLSQLTNQTNIKIPHLGAAQNFVMGKKVLVVFDGVERLVQLLAMPEARHFGLGSRIIITAQNSRLLDALRIKHIYQVDFPPPEEALQIFCMSAFGQDSPYDGFEKLAWEVTNRAGSLPLGLKIMGCHLRGMSKEEWEEELPRLRVRLDGGIGSILKLSYDALCEEDKTLFLYIACYFNHGLNDDTFESVLRHRFSNVSQGLNVLVQRSLVSMSSHKYYSMHNLLAQVGREIVRNKSIDEPGKRQFLVDHTDICNVLTDNTGSRSVIGISLYICSIDDDVFLSKGAFEEMSNLQFLRFHYVIYRNKLHLPEGLNYLPPKLRILCWQYFPMKCLPSTFSPKFLVKIEMEYSEHLEKLWEGIQPLGNLKVMNLRGSRNLKELPDLSTAINLKEIELSACSSLVELPSSIQNLINLQDLILKGCSSLLKIPSSIGNLIKLTKLDLRECSSLVELPSSIGHLTDLGKGNQGCSRHLSECSSLVELPSSIGHLTDLGKGNQGCSRLQKHPSFIGNLTNLQWLYLSRCSNLVELSSSNWDLTNLQSLDISGCLNMVELPSFIGNLTNLQELDLSDCSRLVKLPSFIGNLTYLRKLDLNDCSRLVKIPSDIGNLQMLHTLNLQRCSKLKVLPVNINLGSLDLLDVTDCSQLRNFPEISTNIARLKLCGTLIKKVPLSIKLWSRLQEFSITYCEELEEFPHVLDIITDLELNDGEMEEFPLWVTGMTRLHRLVLKNCRKLVSLPQLPGSLKSLLAENCDALERLACSFPNPSTNIQFINCWKLNEEAREIIIQTASRDYIILPGREVPAFFSYRAPSGGPLTVKLNQRCFPTTLRFKVCFLLICKGDKGDGDEKCVKVSTKVVDKQIGQVIVKYGIYLRTVGQYPLLKEHLYILEGQLDVESSELCFEVKTKSGKWDIAECGVCEL